MLDDYLRWAEVDAKRQEIAVIETAAANADVERRELEFQRRAGWFNPKSRSERETKSVIQTSARLESRLLKSRGKSASSGQKSDAIRTAETCRGSRCEPPREKFSPHPFPKNASWRVSLDPAAFKIAGSGNRNKSRFRIFAAAQHPMARISVAPAAAAYCRIGVEPDFGNPSGIQSKPLIRTPPHPVVQNRTK